MSILEIQYGKHGLKRVRVATVTQLHLYINELDVGTFYTITHVDGHTIQLVVGKPECNIPHQVNEYVGQLRSHYTFTTLNEAIQFFTGRVITLL